MAGKHERGEAKGQFCGIPGQPCVCGNHYIDICKPSWSGFTFPRLVKQKSGAFSFSKKYEAHHILCVSPVAIEVVAKPEIDGLVRNTKWCINNDKNMMAMPLWGHTVMWYCSILAAGGSIKADLVAPPFQNIPQHDWDHNCTGGYTDEVKDALKSLAKEVKEAGHEVTSDDLKAALDDASKDFAGKLTGRGMRSAGTHAGWLQGMSDPKAAWYMSFSMASTAFITEKSFPVRNFDTRVAQWITRIATAIAGG